MARYAMIDIHSGFVWGVEDATDEVEACRQMDEGVGVYGREYETHGPQSGAHRRGVQGYIVHEAPVGFDVTDGQDKAQIAAVDALPRVAIVMIADAE